MRFAFVNGLAFSKVKQTAGMQKGHQAPPDSPFLSQSPAPIQYRLPGGVRRFPRSIPGSVPQICRDAIFNIILIRPMSSKPSDDQLRQAIDAIFNKYDSDKSGTLEGNEIFCLINDAFKSLGRNRQVKSDEVSQFVKAIDKNGDGKISKPELFEILKKLINGG